MEFPAILMGVDRRHIPRFLQQALTLSAVLPLFACAQFGTESGQDSAMDEVVIEDLKTVRPPSRRGTYTPSQAVPSHDNTRDEPAPDAFQVTDLAVWDGRPSLGNIWVEVADAAQPERVQIRNNKTGKIVRGAMFVRSTLHPEPINTDAPVRLSKAAAIALDLDPNEPAMITITAIRRANSGEPQVLPGIHRKLASRRHAPDPISAMAMDSAQFFAMTSAQSLPPPVDPSAIDANYVQVAEANSPDGAWRVQAGLAEHKIPSEVQEDWIAGQSVFRVFAHADTEPQILSGALNFIRFADEENGRHTGTLIAELPNFAAFSPQTADNSPLDTAEINPPTWMEIGNFLSRNEAMSMVQRLNRRRVPTELCLKTRAGVQEFHVFAGPATDTDLPEIDPSVIDNRSFCAGVAASRAPLNITAASSTGPLPNGMPRPNAPVRIRVGEATGGLKLKIPQPFSQDIVIETAGTTVTIPRDTPPMAVKAIADALHGLIIPQ